MKKQVKQNKNGLFFRPAQTLAVTSVNPTRTNLVGVAILIFADSFKTQTHLIHRTETGLTFSIDFLLLTE